MTSCANRRGRRNLGLGWRRGPWFIGEIKEIEQVRLRCIAFGQRRQVKAFFQEMQNCGVVHGCMANIMFPYKRRNDHIGYAEAELRAKALIAGGGRIRRMRSGTAGPQITMIGIDTGRRWLARQEGVRIYGNGPYVAFQGASAALGVLVGCARHRRNVVVSSAAFIESEEENRVCP